VLGPLTVASSFVLLGVFLLLRLGFAGALLLPSAFMAHAQVSQSLGDVARQVRAERNQQQPGSTAESETSVQAQPGAVSESQLFGWIAGGLPEASIIATVRSRGRGFALGQDLADNLRLATGGIALLEQLSGSQPNPTATPVDASNAKLLARAASFLRAEDYRNALANISKVIESEPTNAGAYIALGNLMRKTEDWKGSARAYSRAILLDALLPYPHGELSYAYYRMEDGRSMAEARKMVALDPNSADAHKYLGLALYSRADYGAAMLEYETALKLRPSYANVYHDIGLLKWNLHDTSAAIEAYKNAIELNPKNVDYINQLAFAYQRSGDLEDALITERKAKALAPDRCDLRQNLGAWLCNAGRYEEAIVEFKELLALDPTWNMARPCLYRSLKNTGRMEEAQKVWQEYQSYGGDGSQE
jgi:Tfp pilus assembly protein PilF